MSDPGDGDRASRSGAATPRDEYRIKMWKELSRLSGDRLRQQALEPAPVDGGPAPPGGARLRVV